MRVLAILISLIFGFGVVLIVEQFKLLRFTTSNLKSRFLTLAGSDDTLMLVIGSVLGSISSSVLIVLIGRPQLVFIAITLGGAGGYFFVLNQQQSRTKKILLTQSLAAPAFIDMLSLCVASGMSLRAALQSTGNRISETLREPWNELLSNSVENTSLLVQLDSVAITNPHSVNSRIANTLLVASERGTSLVDVLHGLANEIRAENRRQLLEIAARKDVQMMLPVVFGILPSVVAVALFPAVGALSSVF
jgi:tight adherence protein C